MASLLLRTDRQNGRTEEKEIGLLQQRIRDKISQPRIEERKILTPEQLQKLNEVQSGFGKGRSLANAKLLKGGGFMKKAVLAVLVLAMGFFTYSCASEGYNTQKGTAIGAAVGAIAGQAIGHNTAGTLIGAAGGALAGAVAGNAVDQNQTNKKIEATRSAPQTVYAAPDSSVQEAPPGEWVMVPGQWVGGRWVPAHKQWVPINPR